MTTLFGGQARAAGARVFSMNLALAVAALALLAPLSVRAVSGIGLGWDTFAYHLPFSARLVGLCGEDCFLMRGLLEDRYQGFPLFAHWLQGQLWRWTGTPDYGDLLNLAAMAGFLAAARLWLRVPLGPLAAALLAVPMIQIHLTAHYIDLFVNGMVMIALVAVIRASLTGRCGPWPATVALLALAAAANSKFQMLPIAAVLVGILVLQVLADPDNRRLRGRRAMSLGRWGGGLVGLVFLEPLGNLFTFGNPVFPVTIQILGMTLPGTEGTISNGTLAHVWFDRPRILTWIASVLEYNAYGGRFTPWTLDQGSVTQEFVSFRMGGYFGIWVIINLVAFVALLRHAPPRLALAAGLGFAALTVMTAILPASHELRYYMYWIMALILLNLMLAHRPGLSRRPDHTAQVARMYGLATLICLTSVVLISGAMYLRPQAEFARVLAAQTDDAVLASLADGRRNCLGVETDPFGFLYADFLHPGRDYSLFVGFEGEAAFAACRADQP